MSEKKIDQDTLKREIQEDLKQYASQEVVFEHADPAEVDRVSNEVINKHRETIRDLADR